MRYPTLTLLAVSVSAALLGACAATPARKAMLTYQSVPDGAQIYEGDKSLGTVPVTRTYDSDGTSPNITTPDVRAVWPSGAQTTYFTVIPVGSDRVATLERPKDAPGLQQDLENAKKVAAARKADEERRRQEQQTDINRASARCKQEQAQGTQGLTDDCR
ncbi:MAG TPA: hypothetical protein VMG33_03875 [Steroidobacteraceae bacterium]|nr:hypothetical protein [Steroidobacteraceae bacterium]